MILPSLITVGLPKEEQTDAEAFADLKISELLDPAVTAVMGRGTEKEDILARQELFAELLEAELPESGLPEDKNGENETLQTMQRLHSSSVRLSSLCNARQKAESELEKNALCLCCADVYVSIVTRGCELAGGSFFITRFRDAMKAESEKPAFLLLKKDITAVVPALRSMLEMKISYNGERQRDESVRRKLSLSLGAPDEEKDGGFYRELVLCAADLGLTLPEKGECALGPIPPYLAALTESADPDGASEIAAFASRHRTEIPEEAAGLCTETGFYLSVAALCGRIREAGIPLCFPKLCDEPVMEVREAYDVTLLAKGETNIVPNDIRLDSADPFFYLTGANGGGKTTYLRAVGTAAVFAASGCPLPAAEAKLRPVQRVLTHFPHDERFGLGGRFADEQARIAVLTGRITSVPTPEGAGQDLVLLNETYSTTGEQKAEAETSALATRIRASGAFGIYVTHQHGENGDGIPLLSVVIDSGDSNRRTYKVAPAVSGGGSYAKDILSKYRLDREGLKERKKEKSER